ncbi:MAG: electron transport complex subunit RsxD [Psychrobium sp.]
MFLSVSPSPHNLAQVDVSRVMRAVALATIPGIIAMVYFFGIGSLVQIALCIGVALISEAAILKIRKRPISHVLKDNSALLTGLLLGIAIPPLAPWWISVIGVGFAIIVAKQLYGGLGFNLFNPAMVGYVLLLISFPVTMTNWQVPSELAQYPLSIGDVLSAIFTGVTTSGLTVNELRQTVDGVTMATPLDTLRTDLSLGLTTYESFTKPIFNGFVSVGWVWVNLAFLFGGLWLVAQRIIRWHIPVAILATLTVCATLGYLVDPDTHASAFFHLLSGATMFGAFFIATDPVTAATSNKGKIIFGIIIGVLLYIIRQYGGYPDALAFAVLLANMTVPVIDMYTKPSSYGHQRHGGK